MHNVLLSTEQQKNITSLIAAAKKKKKTPGEITLSNKTHFKIFEKHQKIK